MAALSGLVAEALGFSRRAALLAALLVAVHPATGLVADAISFRAELLAAAALLTVLWASLRRVGWLAAAALLAGGLAKETVLVAGPALFLLGLWLNRRTSPPRFAHGLIAALAWTGALGLRLAFAPAWQSRWPSLTVGDAVGTRLASLLRLGLALLPPFDTAVCDAVPVSHLASLWALGGAAAAAGFAVLAWRGGPAAWATVLLAMPALDLVPVPRFWSLHYAYLPLVFVAPLMALALARLQGRASALVAAALLATAALTFLDARRYADDEALWSAELEERPQCREAKLYLADVMRERGLLDPAAAGYQAALTPAPGYLSFCDEAAAAQNLGLTRLAQGRAAAAEAAFERALVLQRDPLERRRLNHDLAVAAFLRHDLPTVRQRLKNEVARPDALPESLELWHRAEAAGQLAPPEAQP